jgi:hypothetical protein
MAAAKAGRGRRKIIVVGHRNGLSIDRPIHPQSRRRRRSKASSFIAAV